MRLAIAAVVLSFLVTSINGQGELPTCAATCMQTALVQNTTCSATDLPCICADIPLQSAIEGCVLQTCTIKEALVAKNASATMCGAPVRDITAITPIVTGVSGLLAIIAVGIRCVQLSYLVNADTVCAILALVFAIPMGVLEFYMAADGFGRDIWTIEPHKITRIVQFTWLTEIFYFIAIAFTKMSFLYLYLRIFPSKGVRRFIYIMIVFSAVYGIAFTFACMFNCLPVRYIWEKWTGEMEGRCMNFNAFAWAHAAINITSDLIIIALPIPQLLKLSMSARKKFYVIVMFSLGFFITIVSIIRLRSLVEFATTNNPTWDAVPTAYWSVLECFVGIICACLPAVRVFLGRMFPACFGSTQNEYSGTPEDPPSRRTPRRDFRHDFSITKTVGTTITTEAQDGSDVVHLVEFPGNQRADDRSSRAASTRSGA